mmetsp:Transcript_10114/g.23332  ORF Transcript_10114/g.23332 Transcript_10114/m.23332 type:complete len:336 (+) Transcript_10114:3304-4311(+)
MSRFRTGVHLCRITMGLSGVGLVSDLMCASICAVLNEYTMLVVGSGLFFAGGLCGMACPALGASAAAAPAECAAAAAAAALLAHERALAKQRAGFEEEKDSMRREALAAAKLAARELGEAEHLIGATESHRSEMHDTLVNHKREALLSHQQESAKLQKQLEELAKERDGLDARRDKCCDETAEMERSVKSVEAQMREHATQSAVSGGRVNVAYQRKKKRLDEELEALLAGVEHKREQIEDLDKKLEDVADRTRQREDKLKDLERKLVEVLVDQQKKLLRTLTEAGQANVKYMREREKINELRAAGILGEEDDPLTAAIGGSGNASGSAASKSTAR